MGITVSFVYFLVPLSHSTQLLVERLGMPCNANCARKLSRQYVCSLRFSRTDFTLGDETSLDRLAVPNPSTVTSHSSSAQHQLVWS